MRLRSVLEYGGNNYVPSGSVGEKSVPEHSQKPAFDLVLMLDIQFELTMLMRRTLHSLR